MGTFDEGLGAQGGTATGTKVAQPKEAKRTERLEGTLPPGVQIGYRTDGRAKPWFVRHGQARTFVSFQTERDRNDFAEKLAKDAYLEGSEVLDFDPRKWRDLLRLERETGLTLAQIRDVVLASKSAGTAAMQVHDVIVDYLTKREREGLAGDSLRHVRLALRRFDEFAGYRLLVSITPDDVREWLTHLEKAHKFESLTLRHHRKDLRVFFKRCVAEGWRAGNPCEAVVPPSLDEKDQTVASAFDLYRLLRANRDQPIAPRLALELFGLLRCSSVERIQREHVRMDERGIFMPGAFHKSGKRKFRQGHPPALWAWMAVATPDTWALPASMYDKRKGEAFIRAGVSNPGNILRHSGISYLLAYGKNVPRVSYLAQHRSPRTTEGYEGVATERDARIVLSLTPCTVLLPWKILCERAERACNLW